MNSTTMCSVPWQENHKPLYVNHLKNKLQQSVSQFLLLAFVIRLWVELSLSSSNSPSPPSGGNPVPLSVPHLSVHDEEGEKMSVRGARNDRKLAFEKIIDLSDLVYLGTLVRFSISKVFSTLFDCVILVIIAIDML